MMRGSPKLSVLIFTYNRERMLAECLDSVVPTQANCEILIFDDASTDGTPELVGKYAERDPRIRYFRQPTNVGVTANVELAAREARGEFITFLADDDGVEPGNYERKVGILDDYPQIGFIYSLAYATDEHLQNRRIIKRPEYLDHSYIGGRGEFADLISGNYIYANSVLFRRSLMEEHGVMDRTLPPAAYPLSDWDLWLRYTFHTETAFINEPLVNVRFHTSALSIKSNDMAMGMVDVWRKWLVECPEPPTLDARTFERMRAVFLSEVQRLHAGDQPKVQACISAFEALREAATANASLAFARRTRGIHVTPRATPASVVWTGPAWAVGGMASDLRGMVSAAESVAPESLRLEELNWSQVLPGRELLSSTRRQQISDSFWRPLAPGSSHVQVWEAALEYLRAYEDQVSVARISFGYQGPPPGLLQAASKLHRVWVPSQFHRDALREHGIADEKLRILPTCIEMPEIRSASADGGTFRFLSMVRLPDPDLETTVRAFTKEFRFDEPVSLVLVVRMPNKSMDQLIEEIKALIPPEVIATGAIPPINLRAGPLSEDELSTLLGDCQAYFEPRPSTWGRGAVEAMAYGRPVVGLRIGANAELLDDDNSFSVSSDLTPEAFGRLMRQAFSAPDETRRRGAEARAAVAAKHSPRAVGEQLRKLIDELIQR
jgi:hypothetical protein